MLPSLRVKSRFGRCGRTSSLPGFALTFGPTKIEVAKSGDLAYDVGTFELKTNDAQGNVTTEVGKYVVVWKKRSDKTWKAVIDMFSTDR
jgi:ketosteroid isomerase-like protein